MIEIYLLRFSFKFKFDLVTCYMNYMEWHHFFHDEKTTIRNKFAWNWRYCFINPRAQLRHQWFEIVQGTKGCLCLEHERALSRKQARQKAGKNQHFHFFQCQASIYAMIHRHPIKNEEIDYQWAHPGNNSL